MHFTLKETEDYRRDIDDLPKAIREGKLPRVHHQLEKDPVQSGLRSHRYKGFSREKVYRSDVDYKYRIAWFYGPDRSIVLWHVGDHEYIDALENLKRLPKVEISPKGQDEDRPIERKDKSGHQRSRRIDRPRIYGHYPTKTLRVFGVPSDLVDVVRHIEEIDELFHFPIPRHAREILISIYTSPDWTPDSLPSAQRVLFRASADQLENYCKGKIRQLMLDLAPEQERLVNADFTGVMLIKGAAGSGKTTIGAYRALRLAKQARMFDTKPILFITYNEVLATSIGQLMREMVPADEQIHWEATTLRDWAVEYLGPEASRGFDPKRSPKKAMSLLCTAIATILPSGTNSEFARLRMDSFVPNEISQVIKGRGISSWEEYAALERKGRGEALQKSFRRKVWEVYEEYLCLQEQHENYDEDDIYLRALSKLKEDQIFDAYPEVVVDEAQDLSPIAMQLATKLAGSGTSAHLTLLADPGQSIYYRGVPWKEGGVEIMGARVRTLERNYRNVREVLDAAWCMATAFEEQAQFDELIHPESSNRIGLKPISICVEDQSQKDLKELRQRLLNLAENNAFRYSDIGILCRKRDDVDEVGNYLTNQGFPVCHYREGSFDLFENTIKVITFNSAKGLEFPVVFLFRCEEGKIPRNIPAEQKEKDRNEALRMERQLMYVGMTRAADLLFMIHSSGKTSRFIRDIPRQKLSIRDSME